MAPTSTPSFPCQLQQTPEQNTSSWQLPGYTKSGQIVVIKQVGWTAAWQTTQDWDASSNNPGHVVCLSTVSSHVHKHYSSLNQRDV